MDADVGHRIRKRDIRHAGAVLERIVLDALAAIRHDHRARHAARAVDQRLEALRVQHTAVGRIGRVLLCHTDRGKRRTADEGIPVKAQKALAEAHVTKRGAAVEGMVAD